MSEGISEGENLSCTDDLCNIIARMEEFEKEYSEKIQEIKYLEEQIEELKWDLANSQH